nr:hypothetical protein [Candidatus Sigynarchaeota archaeon]
DNIGAFIPKIGRINTQCGLIVGPDDKRLKIFGPDEVRCGIGPSVARERPARCAANRVVTGIPLGHRQQVAGGVAVDVTLGVQVAVVQLDRPGVQEAPGAHRFVGVGAPVDQRNLDRAPELLPGGRAFALALQLAKEYNGTGGWDGLGAVATGNVLENLGTMLQDRTDDGKDLFNFLRYGTYPSPPVIWNYEYLYAICAASFAYNMTTNVTLQRALYDFITRHFDWLLGWNMNNVCLMEGLEGGENTVDDYFTRQRFIPGNLQGAFPGSIVDGYHYFPGDVSGGESTNNTVGRFGPITPPLPDGLEIWSMNAYSFEMACAAFFSQVLGRT